MKRKLATIGVIDEIREHPNVDTLELAKIRGWQVVVKKDTFQAKDLCVYCEIDSLMPERTEFEFLAPRKYRIRTTKLRGQISQGIAFPLSILPGNIEAANGIKRLTYNRESVNLSPGADVTDLLGVIKYEEPMPACLGGIAAGRFPSHSIKTDEERIQNLMDDWQNYHDNYTWAATEKLDGSSTTYTIYENAFGVASRNLELTENEKNSFWKFARENDVEGKMRAFMETKGLKALTMQGELIGEGIQKNKYQIKGQEVRFFRMFDPILYKFFSVLETIQVVEDMGLKMVPIIETDMTLPETIEELLAYADGRSELRETAREGIVFVAESTIGPDARPLKDYQERLSFKVISNKFILKHDA